MKIHFIQKLVGQPWDISRERGRAIMAAMIQKLRAERPAEDLWGDALPKLRLEGDTAIIPIVGTLIIFARLFGRASGSRVQRKD